MRVSSAVKIEASCSTEMFGNLYTGSYSRTSYIPGRVVILETYSIKHYIPESDLSVNSFTPA